MRCFSDIGDVTFHWFFRQTTPPVGIHALFISPSNGSISSEFQKVD